MNISKPINPILKFFFSSWLFIATLIFYLDLWPLWADLSELLNQGEALSQQIASKEKALNQINIKQADLASPLSRKQINEQVVAAVLSDRGKLKTLVIKPESENKQGGQGLHIHLVFMGKYSSLYHFLQYLSQQNMPIMLDEVSVKKVESLLEISVWLRAFPFIMLSAHQPIQPFLKMNCCQHDPFDGAIPLDDKGNNMQLSQMQYIGYVEEANQIEALVLLPNGVVLSMKEHNVLGKERATIVKITPHEIALIDAEQKTYKLIKEVKTGV
jgi:hypothetical protein